MTGYQLTAVIERKGNLFIARCVELDIVSKGTSGGAAMSSLKEAVTSFLEHAREAEILERLAREIEVTKFDVDRTFAFDVKGGGLKVATWTYTIEATDGGCRVTESWDDPRGAAMKFIGKTVSGVANRASHNRLGMETTLNNLAIALAPPN